MSVSGLDREASGTTLVATQMASAIEFVLDKMKATETNKEFFNFMKR